MIYQIVNNDIYIDTDKLKNIDIGIIKYIVNKDENQLKNILNKRLSKYKKRYSEDLKIKLKKIDVEYDLWLENICFYLETINELNKENIIALHKLFYPKNIWGETISHSGEIYYANYKSGVYRDKDEYVIVDNIKYNYLNHAYITQAIDNLINWFNQDKETEIFTKIIIFYIYLCEIHPFYNGNGSIALFLGEYFLYKNNIDFSLNDFLENLTINEKLQFFKNGFSGKYKETFETIKK